MKKFFLLLVCFLCTVNLTSQTITQGDLTFLKDVSMLDFSFDFTEASIIGMSESEFAVYETDWDEDRPRYTGRFFEGLEGKLKSKLFVGSYPDAPYKAVMKVLNIQRKGTIQSLIIFTAKDSDEVLCIINLTGEGGTFGTHLNLIGDGMEASGEKLGILLRRNR